MNYLGTKITCNAGKIVLLCLFAVLQWTHFAYAFKALPSGEFYHKTLTHSGLKNISVELQPTSPKKTIGFSEKPILERQKAVSHLDSEDMPVIPGKSALKDGESHCDNEQLMACISTLPIIPGMVGAGMETPAGSGPNRSGGRIMHVTTLAASGPGSLSAAVEASGPRIVVFDVSGYIEVQDRIKIHEPYLTIAGQTAPYPGITLKGGGIEIRAHDVLIQHIRIRVGDDPNGRNPDIRDGVEILGSNTGGEVSYNVVIDHVSISWGIDENVSAWYDGIHDVTVTNSIISEALSNSLHPEGEHSKGFLVGNQTTNLLVIGNLFAHNMDRNMRLHGGTSTLFVNNVIYNWGGGSSGYGTGSTQIVLDASIVGNEYIRGLDTSFPFPVKIHGDIVVGSRVYIADNEAIETSDDPWSVADLGGSIEESDVRVNTPPNWIPSLTPKKGNEVKNWVLTTAGARRADGDPVDLRIISDVINGTGRIIDSQTEVGGWLPLVGNVRGTGGVPELDIPSNPNEIQLGGYTKIEEWLHLLAKQVETPKGTN